MPKVDASRNYYADLQVTPTSSADDVKKQYRKLAMQWHPDRNRGREEEASKKFQVIQAAFEILTDPTLKRQYDEARNKASGRFPTSSGVRGNPWANAASNFQPPPKRSGASAGTSAGTQPRPTSGAARYSDWGTRTQRSSNTSQKNDPASAKAHYDAWTNMKSSTGANAQRKPPPTPGRAPTSATRESRTADSEGIPRTASQRQKAQASFGNSARRTGYTPRSPGLGDEPPVTNNNYFTTRTHTNIFPPEPASAARHSRNPSAAPDPLAQFRENYMDGRNSAPYATPGGEKTSLFGDGLNRTRSTRESARKSTKEDEDPSFPFPRQRSSSTPRTSSNEGGSEDSTRASTGIRSDGAKSSTTNGGSSTRFGDRYRPKSAESVRATTETTDQQRNGSGTNFGTSNTGNQTPGDSTKYDTSNSTSTAKRFCSTPLRHSAKSKRTSTAARATSWLYRNGASSEAANNDPLSLSPFEQVLKNDVADLIRKKQASELGSSLNPLSEDDNGLSDGSKLYNNTRDITDIHDSFGFGGDPATPTKRFASSSADNISTKFADENPEAWAFTAGGPPGEDTSLPSKLRSQSGSRLGRRSPSKVNGRPVPPIPGTASRRPVPPIPDSESGQASNGGSAEVPTTGFSAAQWGEKIGSEHFIPQPNTSASASPAKRSNSRKNSKPVKATQGGSAGIVDEDDEIPVPVAGWQESSSSPPGAQSPMAMDIDTPPMEKSGNETLKRSQAAGARKIPVEPTRPEWRAGKIDASAPNPPERPTLSTDPGSINATQSKSAPSTAGPFVGQSGGSEDSEEFRATFADFKKVEPFTDPQPTGLHSFADLKTTLPFESRASSQVPVENKVQSVPPLDFPTAPIAPRLHPTMVVPGLRPNNNLWRKYTQDFYNYMEKWEAFNEKVLTHFATRQAEMTKRRQQVGRAWLDSVQGVDAAHVYQAELEQDHDVRKQWMRACDEHQARVREFVTLKDRAK